ncbi:hypothetical protein DFJ74DRAFT_668975 [Hyaloraphidium curvatum]|nr:hypothetical protein DFJ74DRAFT_668975 [Hyaloraphidium curvatum]
MLAEEGARRRGGLGGVGQLAADGGAEGKGQQPLGGLGFDHQNRHRADLLERLPAPVQRLHPVQRISDLDPPGVAIPLVSVPQPEVAEGTFELGFRGFRRPARRRPRAVGGARRCIPRALGGLLLRGRRRPLPRRRALRRVLRRSGCRRPAGGRRPRGGIGFRRPGSGTARDRGVRVHGFGLAGIRCGCGCGCPCRGWGKRDPGCGGLDDRVERLLGLRERHGKHVLLGRGLRFGGFLWGGGLRGGRFRRQLRRRLDGEGREPLGVLRGRLGRPRARGLHDVVVLLRIVPRLRVRHRRRPAAVPVRWARRKCLRRWISGRGGLLVTRVRGGDVHRRGFAATRALRRCRWRRRWLGRRIRVRLDAPAARGRDHGHGKMVGLRGRRLSVCRVLARRLRFGAVRLFPSAALRGRRPACWRRGKVLPGGEDRRVLLGRVHQRGNLHRGAPSFRKTLLRCPAGII